MQTDKSGGFVSKWFGSINKGKRSGTTHTSSVTSPNSLKTGSKGGKGSDESAGARYKGDSGGGHVPGFGKA